MSESPNGSQNLMFTDPAPARSFPTTAVAIAAVAVLILVMVLAILTITQRLERRWRVA